MEVKWRESTDKNHEMGEKMGMTKRQIKDLQKDRNMKTA